MAQRRTRIAPAPPSAAATLVAAGNPLLMSNEMSPASLTAAGLPTVNPTQGEAFNNYLNVGWQIQAWNFYHAIGPFNFAIQWRRAAMSRVALIVAEWVPGELEPVPVEYAPAQEILDKIKWDESRIMGDLELQYSVPGRGYLVGREVDGVEIWEVYSPDQVRPTPADKRSRGAGRNGPQWDWELWEWGTEWVPLTNALVVPVRNPDPRFKWLDISNTQAALGTLREIDLYNRDIISSLVSRIANNGILLVPAEVSFPTREQYNDSDDPFMLELIEIAKQSIKDPGSASAAIPLPLKVPAQWIQHFRHLELASGVDPNVISSRAAAYGILADTISLPREVMTGISNVNHSAGLTSDLTDEAIKMHIAPGAEQMCYWLTRGFLNPQLIANRASLIGPNGGRITLWYDTAALSGNPDLSEDAFKLYDRNEISGEALRRETRFSEDDAPDKPQLREQAFKQMIPMPALALTAVEELTGPDSTVRATEPDPAPDSAEGIADQNEGDASSAARGSTGTAGAPGSDVPANDGAS